VLSLNPSIRCGLRPDLGQIRPMVDSDRAAAPSHGLPRPVCRVFRQLFQVSITTCSTLFSKTDGGRPGRFSSCSPSSAAGRYGPASRPCCAQWSIGLRAVHSACIQGGL
jgi:hypothetical protein